MNSTTETYNSSCYLDKIIRNKIFKNEINSNKKLENTSITNVSKFNQHEKKYINLKKLIKKKENEFNKENSNSIFTNSKSKYPSSNISINSTSYPLNLKYVTKFEIQNKQRRSMYKNILLSKEIIQNDNSNNFINKDLEEGRSEFISDNVKTKLNNIFKTNIQTDENKPDCFYKYKPDSLPYQELNLKFENELPKFPSLKIPGVTKYTFSSIGKLKKVNNLIKMDFNIRNMINKEIKRNRKEILDKSSHSKSSFNSEVSKDKEKIVHDIYKLKCDEKNIPLQRPISNNIIDQFRKKKKLNKIYKSNYNEINGKVSYPSIVADSKILHHVNTENINKLKNYLKSKLEKKNIKDMRYLF